MRQPLPAGISQSGAKGCHEEHGGRSPKYVHGSSGRDPQGDKGWSRGGVFEVSGGGQEWGGHIF